MIVEELMSKWGFDVDFEPLDKLKDKFKEVSESVAHVAEGAAAAAATIFGFAKFTADAGEKALLASQKIGIGVEAYQELAYAGKLVGMSSEEMEMGFERLARSMEDARRTGTGPVAEAFQRLGMRITDSNGNLVGVDHIMSQLADRFHNMPDGTQKTAYAMDLFGRSGAQLIPILNKGSAGIGALRKEARDLGIVLDQETAEASEKFNQDMERAEAALSGVRNVIGVALMPNLTLLIEKFTDWVKVNRQLIATKMGEFLQGASKFLVITWKFATGLYITVKGLVDVFGGFEKVAIAAGIALGLFAAASILSSMGELALAVYGVVTAFTAADAAALAVPIAIGAAIVAIGLVVEDIIAFFQGRNSVTGIMVQKFKEAFTWLEEKFKSASNWIKVPFTVLLTPIRAVVVAIKQLMDIWDVLSGKISGSTFFKKAIGNLSQLLGGNGTLSGAFGFGSPAPQPASSISGQVGAKPALPGSSNVQSQHNSISSPVTVYVGDHASPTEVGNAARDGVNDGWDSVLRGTSQVFQGSGGR